MKVEHGAISRIFASVQKPLLIAARLKEFSYIPTFCTVGAVGKENFKVDFSAITQVFLMF